METMNRRSREYTETVIKKKSQEDPREIAIREKIREAVLEKPWAREAFRQIRQLQIDYLKRAIANIEDPGRVHNITQEVLQEVASRLKSKIVEGKELLSKVPKGSPALVMVNHFGAYKLTGINPKEDLSIDIPGYDAMYPYPMYFAAIYPVAREIGDNLYYVSEDFPLIFGQIHTEAGFVYVPPLSMVVEAGRTAFLLEETRQAINKHRSGAFVNFPEGGTSGKYSGLGPYDLDPFKTGGYVVAANLNIHVIPVAQYFNKDTGFELRVLEPSIPPITNREGYQKIAEGHRSEMQAWLNKSQGK
ncbi:MAG: hypothetical protein ACOYT7_02395 [Patescibacteria group bacterium]